MRILDISAPLRAGTPRWPGSAGFRIQRVLDQTQGDAITNSEIGMDVHCGTHLDAPMHVLPSGDSVDQTDIESCIGPAFVADLRGVSEIGESQLQDRVPPGVSRLLLKTDNSALWGTSDFNESFSALTVGGAKWVATNDIRLVANDYLSIQLFGGDPQTHVVLMEAGVVILEGIDLTGVDPGFYDLVCLPLRIDGAEAAPARAILMSAEHPSS